MDKLMEEEDLKGLEEEIDDAVDRLFVEKKGGAAESLLMEPELSEPPLKSLVSEPAMKPPVLEPLTKPPVLETPAKPSFLEPSYGTEKTLERESPFRPPSAPVPFLKSIEQMEAQLLSLEWEITDEKLKNTKKEVVALRELLKHKADIASILSYMEGALSYMIQDEANIRPPWIKFLLDSKDTIKLLMKKETEGEIDIYKQLAYLGIEARFSCLEGTANTHLLQPSPGGESKAVETKEVSVPGEKKIEDMSDKISLFMERVEEIFGTMERQISRVEETIRRPSPPSMEGKSKHVNVTIFRVDAKLFGVETEKIFKLFKVPITFHEKYSDQVKIRLRDLEVKMINLKKIFSIPGEDLPGEMRILTVKDNGEYKGLMVDQVLKKLSTTSEVGGSYGEFFSGRIYFTYEEQPVEIPILDLKKF
jgi:chemotaxis signal transduction protein